MRGRTWLGLSLLAGVLGCAPAKAPGGAAPKAAAKPRAATAPAVASSAAPPPFQQPSSCPPPLAWEDGAPIESSELCPAEPWFQLYEGECCRYQNGCVAPEQGTSFSRLEKCQALRATLLERAKQPPRCQPDELRWEPQFCAFADCKQGDFVLPEGQHADCRKPIGTMLSFSQNQKVLSTQHTGYLENFAKMADVLGVKQLRVMGKQSYDETPDAKSKTPLSLLRAQAVRDALAKVLSIPIEVEDGGTISRLRGSPDLFREVVVAMAPLEDNHVAQTAPFVLPWKSCDSRVIFRTEIALTKHDGDVLVEVCRDKACSRQIFKATLAAVWGSSESGRMDGDFHAWYSMKMTRQQAVRTGLLALKGGEPVVEMDGETPVSFAFDVTFDDPAISESATYSLRLLRRRTEVALDWSGKLTFVRTLRHPTRDPAPCLKAELEIPRAKHSLH